MLFELMARFKYINARFIKNSIGNCEILKNNWWTKVEIKNIHDWQLGNSLSGPTKDFETV